MDRPDFKTFDRCAPIHITRGNLPHWHQENGLIFVTFRLADSLPGSARDQIRRRENGWLRSYGIGMDASDPMLESQLMSRSPFLRVQFLRYRNRLWDEQLNAGHGACLLRSAQAIQTCRKAFLSLDGREAHVGDFILMPNHVHLLLHPCGGFSFAEVMQRIKGRSARCLNQLLGRSGRLWQKESFDHLVRDRKQLERFRVYIRENPKQAGLKLSEDAYYRAEWLSRRS